MDRVSFGNQPHRSPLDGRRIAVTGRLAALSRADAVRLIGESGGRYCRGVSRATSLLVVGLDGWPLRKDGRLTHNLRRARVLQNRGVPIEILPEDRWLRLLGLDDLQSSIGRLYPLDQVSRVAGVPGERVRSWIRAGLVRPVETVRSVACFDFRQIAAVKRLEELTQSGVTAARLRRSLKQLEAWLPEAAGWLARLDSWGAAGRFVIRSPDGRLAELSGQRLFDFGSEEAEPVSVPYEGVPVDPDEDFERAVELELAGRFAEAAAEYRSWLAQFGPDAEVCFNLGNALFALGETEAAVERFRQAVEIDPGCAAAWSNLGSVLAELGECDEAIAALRKALRLDPGRSEAVYNLADILEDLGRGAEALTWWEAYLRFDEASEWAEYARGRLGRPAG